MTATAAPAQVNLPLADAGFEQTGIYASTLVSPFYRWGAPSAVWQLVTSATFATVVFRASMSSQEYVYGETDAYEGVHFLYLRSDSGTTAPLASRTLPGLTPGATYTVSWAQAGRPGFGSAFSTTYAGNDLRVAAGGRLVYSVDSIVPTAPFSLSWALRTSATFVAPSASPTLAFFCTNPSALGDTSVVIDAVTVTQVSPAPASLVGVALPIPHGGFEIFAIRATASGRRTYVMSPALPALTTPTDPTAVPDTITHLPAFSTAGSGVQHSCSIASVPACGTLTYTSTWGGLPAAEGKTYAYLQALGAITVDIPGLVPGATYTLSWLQNAQPGAGAQPATLPYTGARWMVDGDGNDINVMVRRSCWTPFTHARWLAMLTSARASECGPCHASSPSSSLSQCTPGASEPLSALFCELRRRCSAPPTQRFSDRPRSSTHTRQLPPCTVGWSIRPPGSRRARRPGFCSGRQTRWVRAALASTAQTAQSRAGLARPLHELARCGGSSVYVNPPRLKRGSPTQWPHLRRRESSHLH